MINAERRRYIGRTSKDLFKSYTSEIIRVDQSDLSGYAAHVKVIEVNRPFIVGEKGAELCIGDVGYSWIQFLPDNEKWGLCAIYDNHGDIVEWYFDIVRKNTVDEEGSPYCDDLYLDLAVMPDGRILIFDEDELIDRKIASVNYLETLCSRLAFEFCKKSKGETT